MADYVPLYVPGKVFTSTASATVTGGDLLVVSGTATVAKASAAGQAVIGVAAHDAAANTRVSVYGRGMIHETVATGTVTAGDQVGSSGTAGQVGTVAASAIDLGATYVQATANTAANAGLNTARSTLGIALTTATNPNKVRWMET